MSDEPDALPDEGYVARLLRCVSERSEGGYLLLRFGARKGRGREPAWHVNVRRDGEDQHASGQTIEAALERALAKVFECRADTYAQPTLVKS